MTTRPWSPIIEPEIANLINWRTLLALALAAHGESWTDVEDHTLCGDALDDYFDAPAWGSTEGAAFTLWTGQRVYFPVDYDGREYVGSVARHPDGAATKHIGGIPPEDRA